MAWPSLQQCEIVNRILSRKKRLNLFPFPLNLLEQPRTAEIPPSIGGRNGNAQDFRGCRRSQTHEVTEFDQFRLLPVAFSKPFQRLVHSEQFVILARGGNFDLLNIESRLSATVTRGAFAPGILDQNAPH